MRILVCLTTCDRPRWLLNVLNDYAQEFSVKGGAYHTVELQVVQDASEADYSEARAFVRKLGGSWHTALKRFGRERHDALVSRANQFCAASRADIVYRLPDDVRLCRGFLRRSLRLWLRALDFDALALNPLRDHRYEEGCWTRMKRRPLGGGLCETGWIDGIFIADQRYYERITHTDCHPPPGWTNGSSGVYASISMKCKRLKERLLGVEESLLVHVGAEHSCMHPSERQRNPLRDVAFVDGPEERARLLADA